MGRHPAILFWTTEPDEQDAGLRPIDLLHDRGVLFRGDLPERRRPRVDDAESREAFAGGRNELL